MAIPPVGRGEATGDSPGRQSVRRLSALIDPLRLGDVLAAAYLLAFLVAPLGAILYESLGLVLGGGVRDLPGFFGHLLTLTRNSLALAVVVTALCLAIATPLAVLATRGLPPRSPLVLLLTLPLLSPPFVSAFATILLFGRVGVVTQLLARAGVRLPDIYGFPGLVITDVLHLTPLAFLTIAAGLRTVPKALEEAAVSLGSSPLQATTRVALPAIAPYVQMAALLVFLASFGDVGAPLLVGGRFLVLPAEAFTRFLSFTVDRRVPVLLSAWIVLLSGVILVAVRTVVRKTEILHTFTAEHYGYGIRRLRVVAMVACGLAAGLLLLPYAAILMTSVATIWGPRLLPSGLTLDHYRALWRSVGPMRTSLLVSAIATPVAVVLAVLIGRTMRAGGRLAAAFDYLTLLPFVTSGVVLGIGLVKTYARAETLGLAVPVVSGPGLLVAALVSRRLSYPVRVVTAGLARIDRSLEECSLTLGASPATTFFRVTLPQLAPAIAAALAITFIQIVRELGATLIVHRPGWATLPVQIYAYASEGALGRAGAVSMLLLAMVALATAVANLDPLRIGSRLHRGRA